MSLPSIDRSPSLRPVAVDAVSSRAGVVIPVAPVNPSIQASPPLEPSPSVVNLVNPALQAMGPPPRANEGETTYTSPPDPVRNGASAQQMPQDWTLQRAPAEKPQDPPPKPISKVLMDHLKSVWNASASAVTVEQVKQTVTRDTPTQPTQIPGELTKQTLVYQPSRIKKNEGI